MYTKAVAAIAALGLSACAYTPVDEVQTEAEPPVKYNVSPYDMALQCLGEQMAKGNPPLITVGRVNDLTGKQAISDGGSGYYITQGGPDIVMDAVMTTNAFMVINTQDIPLSNINAARNKDDRRFPFDHYIAGSVNKLDFMPGGGLEVGVSGVGAGYRQYSILVGMNLFLIDAKTDAVIKSAKILKRVKAQEVKAGVARFFGTQLVDISGGFTKRDAVHVALTGMFKYVTYELLSEFAPAKKVAAACDQHIRQADEDVEDETASIDRAPAGLAHQQAQTRS